MHVRLDILTPEGVALRLPAVDRIVIQRSGQRSGRDGELIVLPQPGHFTIPLRSHTLRIREGEEVTYVSVEGGFAEAREDAVTILTRSARLVAHDTPALQTAQ